MHHSGHSVGVIGGADGPTAIFLAGHGGIESLVLGAAALLVGLVVLVLVLRKR